MENKSTGSTRRIKVNGYSNKVRLAKLNKRRSEAAARQAAYNGLSKEDKINRAVLRAGHSKRELARLKRKK